MSETQWTTAKITTKVELAMAIYKVKSTVQPGDRQDEELSKVWLSQDIVLPNSEWPNLEWEALCSTVEVLIPEIYRIKNSVQPELRAEELRWLRSQQTFLTSDSDWNALCNNLGSIQC
jgi:hypothetical protein